MKKKKIIILAVIVLIVIGVIVAGIMLLKNKNDDKESNLSKIYNNLTSSQSYSFSMKQNDKNKTIMAKKGDETAIDQYSENSHSTTLVKDGNTYFVLHDRKEYYVYLRNNVEQSLLTDGISELLQKEYTTGTEKIKGKKCTFEEYNGSTIFMLSNTLNLDDENVKTKFYFNKDKELVYIKTTYGEAEELLEIEISNEIDNSLFEIPSAYAEGN